jgi:hypothetical protein
MHLVCQCFDRQPYGDAARQHTTLGLYPSTHNKQQLTSCVLLCLLHPTIPPTDHHCG